jgi:hypothetical protein
MTLSGETFLARLKEATDKSVADLEKMLMGRGSDDVIPFKDSDFHMFLNGIIHLQVSVVQLRYELLSAINAYFEHALMHIQESSEEAGAIARISAGEAVLEIMEKIANTPFPPHELKHVHN